MMSRNTICLILSTEVMREKIRTQQITQVARIVERLKATPEGRGSMFGHAMEDLLKK